ncbi:MAG: hypothetical protein AABY86_17445, partial [Bdellovibrionota bacterium]
MNRFMKMGLAGVLIFFGLFATQVHAYDLIKRMKLMDDRFKTQDMLRPYGHDFLLDVTAAANSDTPSLLDDVDKIGSLTGTTQEQVNQADAILSKHYNTEKYLRARVALGMPIFSFSAFGIRWQPNLRLDAGLAALINVKQENVTFTSLVNNLDQIPVELRTALIACNPASPPLNDGDDIFAYCVSNGSITQVQADLVKATYGISK